MTQAVSNTVNNIQEMMTQVKQETSKIATLNEPVVIDKTVNSQKEFSNIFDKQIKKEEAVKIQTLGDIKSKKQETLNSENWVNFQEIVSKISSEANVETALDLTLAKDINEIISQLKQAIDETVDDTEDLVEKTDVVEEVTTQTFEKDELLLDTMAVEEEPQDIEKTNNADENIALEQLLLMASNKNTDKTKVLENLDSFYVDKNAEKTSLNVEMNSVDAEILDALDNLTAEDSVNISKEGTDKTLDQIIDEDILKELNVESVKAEVDDFGEGSLMDAQTPEEQGVKAMLNQEFETFELNIDKINNSQVSQTPQTNSTMSQVKTVEINPSKILDQITKQLDNLQNNSKVNIVLNPEALGRVTVQLIKTGEGLSAQLTVSNQEVRDMLMKGLDGLKETLLSHGVGVDNVSVKIADTQKSEYNADWTEQEGSRGGNKEQGRSNREEKEKGLFEKMMAQTTDEENGNV